MLFLCRRMGSKGTGSSVRWGNKRSKRAAQPCEGPARSCNIQQGLSSQCPQPHSLQGCKRPERRGRSGGEDSPYLSGGGRRVASREPRLVICCNKSLCCFSEPPYFDMNHNTFFFFISSVLVFAFIYFRAAIFIM